MKRGVFTIANGKVFLGLLFALPVSLILLNETLDRMFSMESLRIRSVANRVERLRLKSMDGNDFTGSSFLGKRSFVFFGSLECGTLCPVTMEKMKQLSQILEIHLAVQGKNNMQYIFIPLEPISGSPLRLKARVESYGNSVMGVYASDSGSLKEAVASFHVNADLENPDAAGHSASLYYVDEQGILREIYFDPSMTAGEIAADFLVREEGERAAAL